MLCDIDSDLLAEIEARNCTDSPIVGVEFQSLAEVIMQRWNVQEPRNYQEALELYHFIICILDEEL